MASTQDGNYYVEDVIRVQYDPHERDQLVLVTAHADRSKYGMVKTVFEEEGGSSGKDQTLALTKLLYGFSVWPDRVTGSKEIRAIPFASQLGGGTVYFPKEAKWFADFVQELCSFHEKAKYKDQVDAASMAFTHLASASWSGPASGRSRAGDGGGVGSNEHYQVPQPARTGGLRLPQSGGLRP